MRLSLLCLCQMNHKPIPYAIAICWWAQAVLVDIKSRDYGGLILSEWRERRTGRQRERRGERWRAMPPLRCAAGLQVSGCGEVEGRAADWHLPNCLIYQRLWGINSTCWFAKANKPFRVHTDNNMFVTLSPVSHGGNWSSCQKQRDKSLQGTAAVVILPPENESVTCGPIIIVVSAKALIFDRASLLTKGERFLNAGTSFWLLTQTGIKSLACIREDECFCFSSQKKLKSVLKISAFTLRCTVPTRCRSICCCRTSS